LEIIDLLRQIAVDSAGWRRRVFTGGNWCKVRWKMTIINRSGVVSL
jgi:hypothetical protein